jgi:WD40 repeat protein
MGSEDRRSRKFAPRSEPAQSVIIGQRSRHLTHRGQTLQIVRIFISSPGDVVPERIRAGQVINRLAGRFRGALVIEPIFWEWEPLTADKHFQASIEPRPSDTDAVIVILWSRLGVPLPIEDFRGRISGNEVTGTEWEFEDALGAYRDTGRPEVFVYVKKAPVMAQIDDPKINELRDSMRRVENFLHTWFWDETEGISRGANRDFEDLSTFEEMLERHLEKYLSNFLVSSSVGGRLTDWHRGSPFRGLQPFDFHDADIFFGRTRARNELREMLIAQAARGASIVNVLGASGSGKSSLVRAGLVPDLTTPGMIPGVGLVRHAFLRPRDAEANPFAALCQAVMSAIPELESLHYTQQLLGQLIITGADEAGLMITQGLGAAVAAAGSANAPEARLLVVIDQFEELFTQDISTELTEKFVIALGNLACCPAAWIVMTLRTDFSLQFGRLTQLADLTRNSGTFVLSPPSSEELGHIIRRPADAAGLQYEVDLSTGRSLEEELRDAAGNNAGALPLLEYLLERLWQNRDANGQLTFEAYKRLDGLKGAIGHRAEELFSALPQAVRHTLPVVLRALVAVGWTDGSAAVSSRTAPLSLFSADTPARHLIDALQAPDARLLVVDGTRVRVAHEALLVHWPRAAKQIAEDQRDIRTRDRIENDAEECYGSPLPNQSGLLIPAGVRLSDATDLLQRRENEFSMLARKYIAESLEVHRTRQEHELEAERNRRKAVERRLRRYIAVGLVVVFVITAAGVSALVAWNTARHSSTQNNALRLVGEGSAMMADQSPGSEVRGIAELLAAHVIAPTDSDGAMLDAAVARSGMDSIFDTITTPHQIALDPHGQEVATASFDNTVQVWNTASGNRVGDPIKRPVLVNAMTFSPDGRVLACGDIDGNILLWDLAAHKELRIIPAGNVAVMAFSPAGDEIVVGGHTGSVGVWRVTGEEVGVTEGAHEFSVSSVAFSPGGRYFASADQKGSLQLWDAFGHQRIGLPIAASGGAINRVAFSDEDSRMVTGSDDGSVRLWDSATRRQIDQTMSAPSGPIDALAFSNNSSLIVAGSGDGTVRLWTPRGSVAGDPITARRGDQVASVAFSADQTKIVAAYSDGTVRIWLRNYAQRATATTPAYTGTAMSEAFSPDHHLVATGDNGAIQLWDAENGEHVGPPIRGHQGYVSSLAFSPDGKTLASAGDDGLIQIWKVAGGLLRTGEPLTENQGGISTVAFDLDGKKIVAGGDSGRIRVWDVGSRRPMGQPMVMNADTVLSLSFKNDGTKVVAGSDDGTVQVFDVGTGVSHPAIGYSDSYVWSVAFSPDGEHIAAGTDDGAVRISDIAGDDLTAVGERHDKPVHALAFSTKGDYIASGADDGKIRLWDIHGRPVGRPVSGTNALVRDVTFTMDDRYIASSGDRGTEFLPGPRSWKEVLCRKVDSSISEAEWKKWANVDDIGSVC